MLSTNNKSRPYSNLISFVSSSDKTVIYFAARKATQKYKNIQSNPNISFLINNCNNQIQDVKDSHVLTLIGQAHEVEKKSHEIDLINYKKKHPYLAEFVMEENTAFFEVQIRTFIFVLEFEKKYIIQQE